MIELAEVVDGEFDTLETIRNIRNSCREFMTNNTNYISEEQQIEWFNSVDHDVLKLYAGRVSGEVVGYGIVRIEDGDAWLTGAILSSYRGYGYGRRLFVSLISLVPAGVETKLTVRDTNTNAINLYKALGFDAYYYDLDSGIIYMKL